MADNFFQEQPEKVETNEQIAPEKIKLGEAEYSQDELDKLVGLGKKAQEIEKNHGSFDQYVSDYGRRSEEVGRYKKELEELKTKLTETAQAQPQEGGLSPEQIATAKTQLRAIYGDDVVTNKQFAQLFVTYRQSEKLIEECEDYEKEVDGTDGRPKFSKDAILNHMQTTGIKKPMAAYNDMFEKEIEAWKTAKLGEAKATRMVTQESAPLTKSPNEVRAKNENDLFKQITESLNVPSEL